EPEIALGSAIEVIHVERVAHVKTRRQEVQAPPARGELLLGELAQLAVALVGGATADEQAVVAPARIDRPELVPLRVFATAHPAIVVVLAIAGAREHDCPS